MSLGGSKSSAVNSASAGVVSAGVFLAVAAGNEAQSAANVSPASEPTVFTVGATDSSDKFATFSNYGSTVDANAPGVNILSTWRTGGTVSYSFCPLYLWVLILFSRTRSPELLWLLPTLLASVPISWLLRARRPPLPLVAASCPSPTRTRSPASRPEPPTTSSSTVTLPVKPFLFRRQIFSSMTHNFCMMHEYAYICIYGVTKSRDMQMAMSDT